MITDYFSDEKVMNFFCQMGVLICGTQLVSSSCFFVQLYMKHLVLSVAFIFIFFIFLAFPHGSPMLLVWALGIFLGTLVITTWNETLLFLFIGRIFATF